MASFESSDGQATGELPEQPAIERPLSAEELLLDSDSDRTPTLSIVLPTLNEEEGISICLGQIREAIEAVQMTAEIVVSDSSTDRTPLIAKAGGANVVEPDDRGYGEAYKCGFRAARGEYIVMGDADATYDFSELPRLLEPVLSGDADLVLGSRFEGEIRPGSMPRLHRYVGNPLLTRFLNVFYGADVTDAHSGFRVFSRTVLEEIDLQSDGMEFASEMVMDAHTSGLRIAEVPITYHERKGEETLDSFRDGWRHVKFMLVNAPAYLFSGPGLATILIGAVIMAASTLGVQAGSVTFGVHTMVGGSLLTIVGYQVLCFGLFSSVAADSIREPKDPLTQWVREQFRLEHGVSVGLSAVVVGGLGLTYILMTGLGAGNVTAASAVWSLLASTFVVLGILTVFSSFFMSMLAEANDA